MGIKGCCKPLGAELLELVFVLAPRDDRSHRRGGPVRGHRAFGQAGVFFRLFAHFLVALFFAHGELLVCGAAGIAAKLILLCRQRPGFWTEKSGSKNRGQIQINWQVHF